MTKVTTMTTTGKVVHLRRDNGKAACGQSGIAEDRRNVLAVLMSVEGREMLATMGYCPTCIDIETE